MTKDQARLGLQIYKTFAEQTTKVMDYFSVAKRMETVIHITIPQLKHVRTEHPGSKSEIIC